MQKKPREGGMTSIFLFRERQRLPNERPKALGQGYGTCREEVYHKRREQGKKKITLHKKQSDFLTIISKC